jgi:acyl-coenzyme A synthetase/AMP-(fatty) acid ligase
VSVFIAVPTIYRQILQKTTAVGRDVPTLRHRMSAGEQLRRCSAEAGPLRAHVYEGLGMTGASYYSVDAEPAHSSAGSRSRHAVTLRVLARCGWCRSTPKACSHPAQDGPDVGY